jgi:subtilisin family serine protease
LATLKGGGVQDQGKEGNLYVVAAGVNGLHQDFLTADGTGSRVISAYSVDAGSPANVDVRGEGTLAAGVAAGRMHGVAKQAWIHSVKVFRDDVLSYSTPEVDVIRGLQWIVVCFSAE